MTLDGGWTLLHRPLLRTPPEGLRGPCGRVFGLILPVFLFLVTTTEPAAALQRGICVGACMRTP